MVWIDVFFFEQVGRFFAKYSDLSNYTPSEYEKEAGIEDLEKFPPYIGIIKPLMEKFKQTADYFLNEWDAETLYMFLLHDYVENKIQSNIKQLENEDNLFNKTA